MTLRAKIVSSILVVGAGSLLTAVLSVQGPLRVQLEEHRAAEDTKTARLLADEIGSSPRGLDGATPIASRAASVLAKRVTLVAADGVVVYDSEAPARTLENHLHRSEIEQAYANGTGWSARTSTSVGRAFLYVAARVERPATIGADGTSRGPAVLGFVRIATPLDQVDEAVDRQRRAILVAAFVAAMIAVPAGAVAASLATRKLSSMAEVADQVGRGELGRRIELPGDDEVGRLGQAVNLLADRLEEKLLRLTRDRALLLSVLDAVGEGLAFVDERGVVLASNGAFRRLSGSGTSPEGQLLRNVLPDPAIDEAVKRAIETSSATNVRAPAGSPTREIRFRVLATALANLGTVGLLITEDLSPNPRVEALRVQSGELLTSSLANPNVRLPREGIFALELSRAAILLDEPAPPPEVVLLSELLGKTRAADEAPAVYVIRSRAEAALRLVRLELGLEIDAPLPATFEVEPARVALVVELQPKARSGEWAIPRSGESLGNTLRSLARRLALAHLDVAGADVDDSKRKLVIGLPRA